MRLLNTTSFELHSGEQSFFRQEGYAILSHRWVGLEITFEQLKGHTTELRTDRRPLSSPQADKIHGACETARNQGITWIWIDMCCIDKASATEETESINSMFKWYRDAELCITYLCDVSRDAERPTTSPDIFKRMLGDGPSEWFFRGWTLQELLAPREMQFFDTDWKYMGTKTELADTLGRITGIDAQYITGAKHFGEASIAAKMSWMARRATSREEDVAYSMVGIFNVTMTPRYGEGRRAFMRLQEILLSTSIDESLFAWKMPDPNAGAKYNIRMDMWASGEWGLLAASPEWFRDSGDIKTSPWKPDARSFTMTPQGLRAPIRRAMYKGKIKAIYQACDANANTLFGCIPALFGFDYLKYLINKKARKDFAFTLDCFKLDASGKVALVEIYLRPTHVDNVETGQMVSPFLVAKRIQCDQFGLSSKRIVNIGEGLLLQPEIGYPG